MAPRATRAVALITVICQHVRAQIRVMSPSYVVGSLGNGGRVEGSTATFGAPFYGDRVLGRLVYKDSQKNHTHCTADDYNIPDFEEHTEETGQSLINIFVVRRGQCSFTTKVSVAYEKGAHAVIIVDREDSKLTTKDMKNIIVADDGYGDKIHIPSVLIAKEEGNKLIDAVKFSESGGKRSQVVVELAWDLPTDHVVMTDMWMSSASRESLKFLKEFAYNRRKLNAVISFQPHYAVFGMEQTDPNVYNDLCTDNLGSYCAEDPDGPGEITGRDVLEEDVRQLCIHETYKVERDGPAKGSTVKYAAQFWDYIEKLLDRCPLVGSESNRFGKACSEKLMRDVGIDVEKIQTCSLRDMDAKLKFERDNPAWSPRALRINGWRYSGMLEADLVTRAICAGFITQPGECKELIQKRDPTEVYQGAPLQENGVTFGQMISWILGALILLFGVLMLYKRYLKKEMRITLREQVMLEVEAAMGEYRQMQG